jgi:signal transduction histidine kinase
VEALRELLEACLDLSKLDVGAVTAEPRPLALQELLSRVVAEFVSSAEAKGLALTLVHTSLWVRSDPVLLHRIVLNIVSNALRYTVEGRILIGCRRRRDEVELVIADTGVGISAEYLPNVFQEFYRAPEHRGASPGLGLGLAIVKRLALRVWLAGSLCLCYGRIGARQARRRACDRASSRVEADAARQATRAARASVAFRVS